MHNQFPEITDCLSDFQFYSYSLSLMRVRMGLPFVSFKTRTRKTIKPERMPITNIVALAVASLMQGEREAPMVPVMLTHPQLREDTSLGQSSETQTKNTPQMLLMRNLRAAISTISMIVWQLISSLLCVQVRIYIPIPTQTTVMMIREMEVYLLRLVLGMIQTAQSAAEISTSPTSIWLKQTLSPNLSRLRRVPSQMNSIEKLMMPVTIAISLKDWQRKRSRQVTSFYEVQIYCLGIFCWTSTMSSQGLLLIWAMRLKEARKRWMLERRVNSGVYSMYFRKRRPESMQGIRMKKPMVYFQLSMRQERREMREIPREKASWTAMIILSRVLPVVSSLKKLQCRLMAPLDPNPSRKPPRPTVNRLKERILRMAPPIQMPQAINSPFFLPQLSATCDMMIQPTSEPRQQMDCRKDDTHSFEQTMITPQSRAMEDLSGFLRCQYQNFQLLQLQTNSAQVLQSAISCGVHWNSGTQQKKLSEKRIMPAITHLRAKMKKRMYWYLCSPPTCLRRDYILFYYYWIIPQVLFICLYSDGQMPQVDLKRLGPFYIKRQRELYILSIIERDKGG